MISVVNIFVFSLGFGLLLQWNKWGLYFSTRLHNHLCFPLPQPLTPPHEHTYPHTHIHTHPTTPLSLPLPPTYPPSPHSLTHLPPRYGPIYFEAFKLEDRDERDASALLVIKKGLGELPRYGPLWFGLLRLLERKDR